MPGTIGNKNAEKWTEEKALELGNNLIKWLKEPPTIEIDEKTGLSHTKPTNLYFKYFLAQNDLYNDLIDDLCDKFPSFLELIKKAKLIQESKLIEMGTKGLLNPTMTIFCLKNHHNYSDKQEVDHKNNGASFEPPIIKIERYDDK